ncbi:MAG: hypothetical protein ABI334_05755 [Candidatus Dormiibacterota bacterium]
MDLAARDQFNDLETEKARSLDLDALMAELVDSAETPRIGFAELDEADLAKPILWPAVSLRLSRSQLLM